ncbi:site-specific integrase [Bacteroides xylanisolvens]|nr:site-specific integrase [Bacteroides xylanisolvens]
MMKLKSESIVISQAVNEWFTSYLPIARGCSSHTQRSYFTALSQYMQFLQEEKKSLPTLFRQNLIPKAILMTGYYG